MYDSPSDDHSGLSHDLPPGTGNQPQTILDWLWELLRGR